MKQFVIAVSLALVAAQAMAAKPDNAPSGYVTGNFYLQMSDTVQEGYVEGLMDGYLSASHLAMSDIKATHRLDECTKGMTIGQIRAILFNYINDNPVVRGKSMSLIALDSLGRACSDAGHPLN